MSNRFKNWFSYTVFHLSSHKGLFLAILADLTVLIYSIIDDYYRSIDTQKIVLSMIAKNFAEFVFRREKDQFLKEMRIWMWIL